jgi:hypothetical protein
MAKYLWDLNIEDLPLGWQSVYDEAVRDYPKGKYVQWAATNDEVIKNWVDPVQTYDLFKRTIMDYKNRAMTIFQNYRDPDVRNTFTRLLRVDVALFNLFVNWNMECLDVEHHLTMFNPFEYFRNERYVNYTFYFATHYHVPLDLFCDLRVIDINFTRDQ